MDCTAGKRTSKPNKIMSSGLYSDKIFSLILLAIFIVYRGFVYTKNRIENYILHYKYVWVFLGR